MNIQQIAEKAFNQLEPSHTRRMESYISSTNPEIINGRKVLEDRKARMVGIITDAITEAVAAERALADRLAEALDPCLNLSQGWVSYYSTSPQYGNGTTSPVHERILDYAIQSLSAHRAARGAQNAESIRAETKP